MENRNIRFYETIGNEYDEHQAAESENAHIREQVAFHFNKVVKNGAPVIDFGGGTGLDLPWLLENNHKVYLIEPAQAMREKAKARAATIKTAAPKPIIIEHEHLVHFQNWQNNLLPVDQKTDAVLANFGVINSIADPHLLFQKLSLVIKPGGHLFIIMLDSSYRELIKRRRFRLMLKQLLSRQSVSFRFSHNGEEHQVMLHRTRKLKQQAGPDFQLADFRVLRSKDFLLLRFKKVT